MASKITLSGNAKVGMLGKSKTSPDYNPVQMSSAKIAPMPTGSDSVNPAGPSATPITAYSPNPSVFRM